MGRVTLGMWLWGNHAEARQPTTHSLSPEKEQLAEYRELVLDHHKQILTDRRSDPLQAKIKVAPWDPRFPNYDITNWCQVSYEDHFRCRKLRGDDFAMCDYFKNVYMNVCPRYMIERWDAQREIGHYLPGV